MRDKVFVDTNLFIYYFQKKTENKKDLARDLISQKFAQINISTQILSELFNVLRKTGNPTGIVEKIVNECIVNFNVHLIDIETIHLAMKIHGVYGFSYYDSQVVSSAILSNCHILYTEDLQHNQLIENKLRVVNPFV